MPQAMEKCDLPSTRHPASRWIPPYLASSAGYSDVSLDVPSPKCPMFSPPVRALLSSICRAIRFHFVYVHFVVRIPSFRTISPCCLALRIFVSPLVLVHIASTEPISRSHYSCRELHASQGFKRCKRHLGLLTRCGGKLLLPHL